MTLVTAADSTPAAGQWVVLHRVGGAGGAPVDSMRTNRDGTYRFASVSLDTLSIYVVSAEYQSIAYFSPPIRTGGSAIGRADTLLIHETSVGGPDIRLAQRHVVIRDRDVEGSFRALEILVLANDGVTTRIAADTLTPVWVGRLPAGVEQVQIGESDVSDQTLRVSAAGLEVFAPIPPGERQIVLGYLLPRGARDIEIPVDPPAGEFHLLVGDTLAEVAGPVAYMGPETLENVAFRRYRGDDVPAGSAVRIEFTPPPIGPESVVWIVAAVSALALGTVMVLALKRPRRAAASARDETVESLAAAIGALDERFESGSGQISPEEYASQRAVLKARLTDMLAARGRGR